eukprot:COSAG02_NODE_754_length_17578_cov_97.544825_14_plen_535_part_00
MAKKKKKKGKAGNGGGGQKHVAPAPAPEPEPEPEPLKAVAEAGVPLATPTSPIVDAHRTYVRVQTGDPDGVGVAPAERYRALHAVYHPASSPHVLVQSHAQSPASGGGGGAPEVPRKASADEAVSPEVVEEVSADAPAQTEPPTSPIVDAHRTYVRVQTGDPDGVGVAPAERYRALHAVYHPASSPHVLVQSHAQSPASGGGGGTPEVPRQASADEAVSPEVVEEVSADAPAQTEGQQRADALDPFLTPMTWQAVASYAAQAAPASEYVAAATGMLETMDIDLSMFAGATVPVLSFVERVDKLCKEVSALEELVQACVEADSADEFSAELVARVGATALGASPSSDSTAAARAKRREARQARLAAAKARRIASEERRDALKAQLAESRFPWKLAITPSDGKWQVRITETASRGNMKVAKPELAAAERPIMSKEHTEALSARVHEEELLRAAMAAERTANQKERAATELERQAMVKERAIQHEIDVHARLLAEEQAQADEIAAEEKVRLLSYTIHILELTACKPSLDLTARNADP